MSEQPLLSAKDKARLLAFQETYDTKTLIIALLYKETAGCHCDECYARYLRAMADKINPRGASRMAMTHNGMVDEYEGILRRVQ